MKFIIELAIRREKSGLPKNESVELFDEIDSMDIEELSSLYALVQVGLGSEVQEIEDLRNTAKSVGFSLVGELFELDSLGTALRIGIKKFENENI